MVLHGPGGGGRGPQTVRAAWRVLGASDPPQLVEQQLMVVLRCQEWHGLTETPCTVPKRPASTTTTTRGGRGGLLFQVVGRRIEPAPAAMNDVGPNSSLGGRIMILAVAWLSAWQAQTFRPKPWTFWRQTKLCGTPPSLTLSGCWAMRLGHQDGVLHCDSRGRRCC